MVCFGILLMSVYPATSQSSSQTLALSKYVTDLDLVRSAFQEALSDTLSELALHSGALIEVQAASKRDYNWILEDALKGILLNQGYSILEAQASPSKEERERGERPPLSEEKRYLLSFRVAELGLIYRPLGMLSRTYAREVYGSCLLELVDRSDGAVLWSRWCRARSYDQVPRAYEALLESPSLIKRDLLRSDRKLGERVLVGLFIAGLIVVFLR